MAAPKPLASLLPALAVAVAALVPQPVRAGDDLARILAGAAGIAILYGILQSDRRDRAHAAPPVQPLHPPHHQLPPQHRPAVLPARCAVTSGGQGWEQGRGQGWGRDRGGDTLYLAPCLAREGVDLRQLPQRCAVELRGPGRARSAYSANCLARAGWREEHAGRWR